jgi:cell wall-associated NlpC family hydrolase
VVPTLSVLALGQFVRLSITDVWRTGVAAIRLRALRAAVVLALTLMAMIAGAGVSLADPGSGDPPPGVPPTATANPPADSPDDPSDDTLRQSRHEVDSAAAQVGRLTAQLAEAQHRADDLGDRLEVRRELANKALVDLRTAQAAVQAAAARVEATRTGIVAADGAVADAQARVDRFVAAAYQQGLTSGSLGLLAQATSPQDLISRAQLTDALAQDQRAALDTRQRAQIAKVNADSLARAAQLQAQERSRSATQATQTADGAVATARSAVEQGAAELRAVDTERAGIERRLDTLTAHDAGLRAQRRRYLDYQRQVAEAARVAAQAAATRAARSTPVAPSAGTVGGLAAVGSLGGGTVNAVIDRALAQVGVTYAWGGGTTDGASRGIHDGGEADEFGDYRKTGFDCSGLMLYAFGAAGINLPHYSGYQYDKGTRVPVAQAKPGDMLFWADHGTIHHVALYLGHGQMVEAPYSGGKVRIAPVRYGDGLLPDAVRLLGAA